MSETANYLDIRFSEKDRQKKERIWKVLCNGFFQQFVGKDQTVLDMGAGTCEFINNIVCKKKYALDIHKDSTRYANQDVIVLTGQSAMASEFFQEEKVDVVFLSNFLEHMNSKDEVRKTFSEIKKILSHPGKLLILQPNIRYCYKQYWDFFDHNIPLSHKSIEEVLRSMNFKIVLVKPKFLPYSTKSALPFHPMLVKIYLRLSPLQFIMGKQMFVYATT
jgi:SAM-dependent methyltransferase